MSFSPYYNSGAGMAPVLAGLFAVIFILSILCAMAVAALMFISNWKIFQKMGEPGWKGIIPFYSTYVLFDRVWNKKYFWTYVIVLGVEMFVAICAYVLSILMAVFAIAMPDSEMAVFVVLMIIFIVMILIADAGAVIEIVLSFKLYNRLAHAFGKGTGFAAGLTFVSAVFLPILAFGNARFIGRVME